MREIIFILLIVLTPLNTYASNESMKSVSVTHDIETTQKADLTQTPNIKTDLKSNNIYFNPEIIVNRIDNLEKTNSKLLTILYWSLGFVGSIIVLFLGSNIYFTKDRYDSDKQSLNENLENKIILMNSDINAKFIALQAEFKELVNEHIENINESLEPRLSELKTSIQDESADDIRNLEIITVRLSQDIIRLKYNLIDLEISTLDEEKNKNQILEKRIKILECAKELNYEWLMTSTLQKIIELLKAKADFYSLDLPGIHSLLDSLPVCCETQVKSIKKILASNLAA
ncbi:hypothetical protein DSLASN_10910 [Desulfoluna limicola]|uniref:Uncharacterized protein n=1 Tax=Desulfoluna limicola TaxID=2810562 RepID=A0ABM7PE73_9BACT|nr:hypothetical protein [Desulfoluna limicola]BCS95459.1 hypothetical protein DSLASN_10910 [Desulfoluna limicola]